ncbi:hypothetical protein OKJ48_32340 [Streptomyces kunmingensis]|uniref:Integral membrane protein n=1 Tax=Streptomyces kunmingensis TaxID=68225 RepID=A0ABU6CJJ0_9ACTN|nr:hypothetical protein [Streptomyces kunmingensis]MEB3964885.1 hypothetical protein [Streptomyces kunmingensis]
MYGPGATPPSRNEGTVITLRVLFPVLSVLSCGLLSCVPLFRIAVLRGKPLDWLLAWAALPVSLGLLAVVGSLPEKDPRTDVALAAVLIIAAGSAAHFLVFDIRRAQPVFPYPPTATTVGYGYPQRHPGPQYPQARPQPQQQPPYTQPFPPSAHNLPTQAATPTPSPTPPPMSPPQQQPNQGQHQVQHQNAPQPPHRIDQVRAELDELSDYLRKREDDGR